MNLLKQLDQLRYVEKQIINARVHLDHLDDVKRLLPAEIANGKDWLNDCERAYGSLFLDLQNAMSYRRFCRAMGIAP